MNKGEWRKRISQRSDFSAGLVHLTKSKKINNESYSALEILMKILIEQKLEGSTTESGFICGDIPAVCFQDIPLYSVCENILYEQKLKKEMNRSNYRYTGFGLRFSKDYIYRKGGRPVIYDNTNEAKRYLTEDNHWRIVNFNLSNKDKIIDWSHEREWRVPGYLSFELNEVEVLIHNYDSYKKFIKLCRDYKDKDILYEVKSVIVMPSLLF